MGANPPRLAAIVLAVLLGGCATEVTSIRDAENTVLEEAEGFLLIEVDTTHNLESIFISGPKDMKLTSGDLRAGSNYILVNLPAGDYEIDRVDLNDFWYYRLSDEMWRFSVREGLISYVGNLAFEGGVFGFYGHLELINRSSFALEYLKENFPGLLATHRVDFGGPGEDGFFEVVSTSLSAGQD